MKIFGLDLFKSKKGLLLHDNAMQEMERSEFLVDFYRGIGNQGNGLEGYVVMTDPGNPSVVTGITPKPKEIKKIDDSGEKKVTPKDVYELKMLHDTAFKIKTDPEYIDNQVEDFKERLNMLNTEDYDMRSGLKEVASIVGRLENRKKYKQYEGFFSQFPYTMSGRIEALTKKNDHLQLGQVAQFVADLPKEAIDTMKEYTGQTKELCGKKPIYYIIADKKDFKKTTSRRDPILLAQSPFGHVWQILGAWDEEMILVDEL